jgi:hypothetical protein
MGAFSERQDSANRECGEIAMTDKQKPDKVNRQAIKSVRPILTSFSSRFEQFEELQSKNELTTQFIAFEALNSIIWATAEGYKEDEILNACPDSWGDETVRVPADLLKALTDCWQIYKDGPSGQSLGEAFGIEGGGQGKRPSKEKQATRDRRRRLANEVEIEYRTAELTNIPITQSKAIEIVSENQGVQFSTVESAFKEYKREIRHAMRKYGMFQPDG